MIGNHLMYSKKAGKVMKDYAAAHCGPEAGQALLEKTREIYLSFLPSLPELGGKKNYQAQSVYDCIGLFALYEAADPKPTLEEFEDLVNKIFVPGFKLPFFYNMNWPPIQRLAHGIFSRISRKSQKYRQQWPGNYHMEVDPYDPKIGIRYRFTTCPIADFAHAHGYTHLMSAMCNPDYPTLKAMHAGLIRTKTCGRDDCCDYWIVGDRDPQLDEHPVYKDPHGYLKNK